MVTINARPIIRGWCTACFYVCSFLLQIKERVQTIKQVCLEGTYDVYLQKISLSRTNNQIGKFYEHYNSMNILAKFLKSSIYE